MVGVIPPFASGHVMDNLTTWTRTVSTLKLVQTEGRRLALLVCMRMSIDMVIPVVSNA